MLVAFVLAIGHSALQTTVDLELWRDHVGIIEALRINGHGVGMSFWVVSSAFFAAVSRDDD